MTISIFPVTENFAAEIGDVDLSKPLNPACVESIKQAFWRYSVLIFPDQILDHQQHMDFAENFGPHETSIRIHRGNVKQRLPDQIADVSNISPENKLWGDDSRQRQFQLGNRLWHTDSSFKKVPALASLLYAKSIPPVGGLTEFADLRAAYDALPEAKKKSLEGLIAEHSIAYSRARLGFTDFDQSEYDALPPVPQAMVRTIPQNGRKGIYVASHAGRVFGMAEDAGKALIEELLAHATQRQFVYTHRWRVHDLVMWDNRCTLHRGTPFEDLRYRRDVQRATVSDIASSCEQEGLDAAAVA